MSRNCRPRGQTDPVLRCARCGACAPVDLTSSAAEGWTGTWEAGRLAQILCPLCQTPLEHAAAEANGAEVAVARAEGGTFLPDPVLCITGTMEDPGTVLYGRAHLQRISAAGRAEHLSVQELPDGARCVPVTGGVVVYLPGQRAAP
ncbi:hypothetical protein [Streptomyces sp. NPDC090132]|uniref:hypothetical protein n=1 Tax=Streptomyces sp. NPDC090132 TaxID=3365955 RepID=UPI003825298D